MHVDETNASTNASTNADETGADKSGGQSANADKGPGQVPGSEGGGASADAGQAVPGGPKAPLDKAGKEEARRLRLSKKTDEEYEQALRNSKKIAEAITKNGDPSVAEASSASGGKGG